MYFQHCIHIHALAGSAQYDFCRGGKKLNLQWSDKSELEGRLGLGDLRPAGSRAVLLPPL